MKSVRLLAAATALMVGLAGGILLGARRTDAVRADLRRSQADSAAAASQVATLRTQRDRLRAERNLLEARLAAEKAPPVCPQAYVPTGDSGLDPYFSIDYPCGWHVMRDARPGDGADATRPGAHVELTFISRLPISLAPKNGPVADVEIADWTDDPGVDGDGLETLDQWIASERAAFTAQPKTSSFEGGNGIDVHKLTGTQSLEGTTSSVLVLLWEFEDTISGARHVVRVFAVAPGRKAREAIDRLARSFSVPTR